MEQPDRTRTKREQPGSRRKRGLRQADVYITNTNALSSSGQGERRHMIVYISGPITGRADKDYLIEFMEAELKMKREGYEVINPATIGFLFPNSFEHQDYMDIDIPLLKKCEAIYMLPGWEESKGASTELRYAIKHDYTILGEVTGICAKPEPEAIHEGDVVEIISEASRFSKGLKATVLKKLTDHPDDHFNFYIRPEGGTTACWCREEDIRKITGGENEER